MSSAILYVAIVAIWIGVLVPRFVHREGTQSDSTGLRRFSRHFGAGRPAEDRDGSSAEAAGRAGFDPGGRPRYTSFVPPEPEQDAPASPSESRLDHGENVSSPVSGNRESMAQLYEADPAPAPVRSYGWSADEVARQERTSHKGSSGSGGSSRPQESAPRARQAPEESRPAPEGGRPAPEARHDGPPPRRPRHEDRSYSEAYADDYYADDIQTSERHTRMLRSRRRMLWLLLALTVVGIALTYLKLASWWIIIPPIALLGGYLMLLREAAQADAEGRERRVAERANARAEAQLDETAADHPAPAPASATPAAPATPAATVETGPRAAVIDLSEHVNDQLYDQYADAKLRAVGD